MPEYFQVRGILYLLQLNYTFFIFIFSFGGSYPAVLKVYPWLCAQIEGQYRVPGMKPGLVVCKAITLSTLLLCQSHFRSKSSAKVVDASNVLDVSLGVEV